VAARGACAEVRKSSPDRFPAYRLTVQYVPAAKRVAVLTNPTDPANELLLRDVETAATGQQIIVFEAATSREIDAAFDGLVQEKVDALFVGGGAFLITRRVQLAVLTARYVVPAAYTQRAFVEAGGLMSYGTNLADTFRQVGAYAARILKGAKSMDLPVMQATKFELVINRNTARALGLTVAPTLLATADEVIE
jgi:putative tryptophan/tyrosine transport system substrate-binding protein